MIPRIMILSITALGKVTPRIMILSIAAPNITTHKTG
jgi:hypothetical protein